jgi:hypothetical protein
MVGGFGKFGRRVRVLAIAAAATRLLVILPRSRVLLKRANR